MADQESMAVTEEVRNLAARSAKAAKETTDMIEILGKEQKKRPYGGGRTANRLPFIQDSDMRFRGIAELDGKSSSNSERVRFGIYRKNQIGTCKLLLTVIV